MMGYLKKSPSTTLHLIAGFICVQAFTFWFASKNLQSLTVLSILLLIILFVVLLLNLLFARGGLLVRCVVACFLVLYFSFWYYVWVDFWTYVD
jgi:hypothetical protein